MYEYDIFSVFWGVTIFFKIIMRVFDTSVTLESAI